MDKLIDKFPQQLLEAIKIGNSFSFPEIKGDWQNVVLVGLGGSGIGGTIVQNYVKPHLAVPFWVNKTYEIPAFVNENTLVLVCSYSGNTEEAISGLNSALDSGAKIVCITSGGKIEKIAKEKALACFKIPGGMPPRACLGYSLVEILFALHYAGLTDKSFEKKIESAAALLEERKEQFQAQARLLAEQMFGKIPVIYAANQMEGVAVRWRQQLNENSKVVGWENVIPEMNHNELVGWRDENQNFAVIFLHTPSDSVRVQSRMSINKEVIIQYAKIVLDVEAIGENYWEQAFSLIHIGDWLSLYLAELRGVDAVEVNVIDYLKKRLASE